MGEDRLWLADSPKLDLWSSFCDRHAVADRAVPLFAEAGGRVVTRAYGHDHRLILARSPMMEALVIREVRKVLAAGSPFEGVLYMTLWLEGTLVLPLYVGRAGRYGREEGNVSANLRGIERNPGKFARWGSNYAYHIGDLSAAVCPSHEPSKIAPTYLRWARRLFEVVPEASLNNAHSALKNSFTLRPGTLLLIAPTSASRERLLKEHRAPNPSTSDNPVAIHSSEANVSRGNAANTLFGVLNVEPDIKPHFIDELGTRMICDGAGSRSRGRMGHRIHPAGDPLASRRLTVRVASPYG